MFVFVLMLSVVEDEEEEAERAMMVGGEDEEEEEEEEGVMRARIMKGEWATFKRKLYFGLAPKTLEGSFVIRYL